MLDSIRRIMVPTDFSELSGAALRTAAKLAAQDDASIQLFHSLVPPSLYDDSNLNLPESVWEEIRKGTRERMYDSQLMFEEAGVSEIDLIVEEGRDPADAIARSAKGLDSDLVVMATHGRRGLRHLLLGSVTERTMRASPVPVLAIKNNGIDEVPLRRILLATDFSTHSECALELAWSLAKRYDAHLDVVHVLDRTSSYLTYGSTAAAEFEKEVHAFAVQCLDEIGATIRKADLSIATHLSNGIAAERIAHEAERLNSDLIVMGTHGFTGISHAVIGSVTERTMRLAPCSVLTTKADQDHSQV